MRRMLAFVAVAVFAAVLAILAAMQNTTIFADLGQIVHAHGGKTASPYAGFETREIKSLSQSDIDELRRGAGWGLALAAELNGAPGPAHLLELREQIGLTPDQTAAIERIFEAMQREARAAGLRFIAAEHAIETAFRAGDLSAERLRALVEDSAQARAELRLVHLLRHLETPVLMTPAQIASYNRLRGYGSDPCQNIPEGHNAQMWRRHNNCG
jgi:Spy/CpxP family protein refolding chaperone